MNDILNDSTNAFPADDSLRRSFAMIDRFLLVRLECNFLFCIRLVIRCSGLSNFSVSRIQVYLRRIFERIVQDYRGEYKNNPNWNDLDYEKLRFNEKIEYLERFRKKIIPDNLSDIKTIIYGKLSQGVHELSEQDALELFPYLKIVIEMILDKKIAEKERIRKIDSIKRVLRT